MSRRPDQPWLFAVEDAAAQFTWRDLGDGPVELVCGDQRVTVESGAAPGVASFDGLRPDTSHVLEVRRAGGTTERVSFRTLAPPPGEELYRFATISDLHIGRPHFGFLRKLYESPDVDLRHPLRCGAAAIRELTAWGAQRLVVKGDLVDSGRPEQWDQAAELLRDVTMPLDLIAGNHENSHPKCEDPWEQAERVGLPLRRGVETLEVPALRLVFMDSTTPRVDVGRWHHLGGDAADAVGGAEGAAMLIVHHHPQPLPFPIYLPRGIPSITARPFIADLARANPAVLGTSGHTHRNRRRDICGLPWTEVGSPKDYPGGWAGYVVHEGGIRQVVRRVADPDCLEWLDHTGTAEFGLWGRWSPGTLADRCFSYTWPTR